MGCKRDGSATDSYIRMNQVVDGLGLVADALKYPKQILQRKLACTSLSIHLRKWPITYRMPDLCLTNYGHMYG